VAELLAYRRLVVLLALVALAVIAAVCGNPGLGMWDGPL